MVPEKEPRFMSRSLTAVDPKLRLSEHLRHRVADLRSIATTFEAPPDATLKYVAYDQVGRRMAVVIMSPEAFPTVVANELERKVLARRALGPLGDVILSPMESGTLDGASYAIYPFCRPLYKSRAAWWIQRTSVRPAVLSWLRAAAETTLREPEPQKWEKAFAEPLRHVASLERLPMSLRDGASAALSRLEAGDWEPRFCMMHGDLWKGNVLLAPGERRWNQFALIDWGASLVHGYAIYDLIRLAMSTGLIGRGLEREVWRHCKIVGCDIRDAQGYLLASLGHIGLNLDHLPLHRYLQLSTCCWDWMKTIGGD
jgi:Phosphotransferase enzyme family